MHYRLWLLVLAMLFASCARGGPPFLTDDPEPVPFGGWEVYLAAMRAHDNTGGSGTLPHVEINHGAAPNMMWHIIVPYAYASAAGTATARGLGDIELGVKYRFQQETPRHPMAAIFPLLELPTGNAERGLGSGHLHAFLPVWLQRTRGQLTNYGGGGVWINPGTDNHTYVQAGDALTYDFTAHLTLGGEIYYLSPTAVGVRQQYNFNLGGIYNFDSVHHLLFTAGRSLHGATDFTGYLAYQWTFGGKG